MPKDIRHLSNRRINQLMISQIANFPNENHNIYRNNIIEDSRIDLDNLLVSTENNNHNLNIISLEDKNNTLINDTVTSSVNTFQNSNNDLIFHNNSNYEVEDVLNEENDLNVIQNNNYEYHTHDDTYDISEFSEELSLNKKDLVNDLRLWVIKENTYIA